MSGLNQYAYPLQKLLEACNPIRCVAGISDSWFGHHVEQLHFSSEDDKLAIECPSCDNKLHLKCTDIGSLDVFYLLGNYMDLWRCPGCVDIQSQESQTFNSRLNVLHKRQISFQQEKILEQLKVNNGDSNYELDGVFKMVRSTDEKLEEILKLMKKFEGILDKK